MLNIFLCLFCIKCAVGQETKQIVKSVETVPAYGSQINPRYSPFVRFFSNNGKDCLFVYGGVTNNDRIFTDSYVIELHPLHIERLHLKLERKKPLVKNFAQFKVNNTFFIWGGKQDSGFSNNLWAFDFSSKEWKEVDQGDSIPEARQSMAYASDGEKLYIFGGISESGLLNDLWEFDIQNNQWKELEIETGGVGPEPCSGAVMLVSNGYAVLYGGDTGGDVEFSLKMFRIKIDTISSQSWKEVKITDKNGEPSNIPDLRTNFGHSTFISSDGAYSYIFGGCPVNKIRNEFNSLLILDCSQVVKGGSGSLTARFKIIELDETNKSDEKKDLFRVDCGCTTDKDGNLYIFGGITPQGINSDLMVAMKEDLSINQTEKETHSEKAIERRKKYYQKFFDYDNFFSKPEKFCNFSSSHELNSGLSTTNFNSSYISLINVSHYAPSPRVNPIVGSFRDSIFVYGGRDPITGEIFNDMYLLSNNYRQWTEFVPEKNSETPPARELASYCYDNGRLLIFGGLGPNPKTGKVEPSNELWEFSFITYLWKQLGKNSFYKPIPVCGAAMEMYMDFLIVVGGRTSYGMNYGTFSVFMFQNDQWVAQTAPFPLFRISASVIFMTDPPDEIKNISVQRNIDSNRNMKDFSTLLSAEENPNIGFRNYYQPSPNLVFLGGMLGASPLHGYYRLPIQKIVQKEEINYSNYECNGEKCNQIFGNKDGIVLPLNDSALMFGGMRDGIAKNTFKVVKFAVNGTATVTEDNGTAFVNGKNLDVVDAGCAIHKREVFCFGGRRINANRTVMNSAVDSLRIFKLQNDLFDCAPGSYQDENGECQFCKIGYYSNEFSSKECDPCPEGTIGISSGSQKYVCIPVSFGHYTIKDGSNKTFILTCPENKTCPMGSASSEYKPPEIDPKHLSQPEVYKIKEGCETWKNALSYIIPTGIGAVVAFILLCLPSRKYLWKFDGYSSKYTDSLDPDTHKTTKQIKKTTFGGFISIVGLFFMLGAIISNILGIALFNIDETKTTVDAISEENVDLNSINNSFFKVNLTLMDYSGECVNELRECSRKLGIGKTVFDPFGAIIGSNNNKNYSFTPKCTEDKSNNNFYPPTKNCLISINASNEDFSVNDFYSAFFSMFSFERNATCRAIKVSASIDSAIPAQSRTKKQVIENGNYLSSVEELTVSGHDSVFSGSKPTNITLELVNSIFRKDDFIKKGYDNNGHLLNHISFINGSTATYHDMSYSMGFGVNIKLKLEKTVVVTQRSMKVSAVMFISSLGGSFVYFGYIGNVFLPIFETLMNFDWPCGKKIKKKVTTVFHDSSKKNKKTKTSDEYMEELKTIIDEPLSSSFL